MTASQYIDYDALALEALRGVVKACLTQVARTGLVGEHHFYIAFNTQAPGVTVSKRLKEKYPQEMTIVLQHRFWDLAVSEDRFEVKLTFDGILERLVVPFKAIMVFYDPSVPYGLQFGEAAAGTQGDGTPRRGPVDLAKGGPRTRGPQLEQDVESRESADEAEPVAERRRPQPSRVEREGKGRPQLAPEDADGRSGTGERPDSVTAKAPQAAAPKPAAVVAVADGEENVEAGTGDGAAAAGEAAEPGGAKIFDLAKFRSKK